MKKFGFVVAAALSLVAVETAYALQLKFQNDSNWAIHELYFSPADQKSWGPDQLGEEVIEHGETYTLRSIPKGKYDVKIVDEDGDSCEIEDVDFDSSEHFVLTEDVLLGCQKATAAESGDDDE